MPVLLDAGVKVLVLLLLAALGSYALRSRSAALRHTIWMAALGGALLLPALSLTLPAWRVEMPIAAAAPASASSPAASAAALPPEAAPAAANVAAISGENQVTPIAQTTAGHSTDGADAGATWRIPSAGVVAAFVWGAGAVMLVLLFAAGWWRVARLVRAARPAGDAWTTLASVAARSIGLRRLPRVVLSPSVSIPAVWGAFRPVLLLPAEAGEWTPGERRSALLHELAHVKRRDGLAQLVSGAAVAVWWFLPPVWLASRRAADERERACDDVVLGAGTTASEYAGDLLRLVQQAAGAPAPSAALAMGRPSRLAARVRAILDPARRRGAGGRTSATMLAGAAVLVWGIAVFHPVAVPVRQGDAPLARAVPTADPAPLLTGSAEQTPAPREIVRLMPGGQLCQGTSSSSRGSSNRTSEDGEGHRSWTVHYEGDDCSVDLRAEGTIEFNDDFTDVARISSGGFFKLETEDHGERRALELRPGNGGLVRTYRVNGAERPWDQSAKEWFAQFLVELDRRTAVGVDVRFPRLYGKGGAAAVLRETAQMPGDYPRSQYYAKLLGKAQLAPAELTQLLDQVRAMHTGDYYSAQALNGVARQNLSDAGVRASYLAEVQAMGGDYYRAQSLEALIAAGKLAPAEVALILGGALKIGGDFHRAEVLTQLIQAGKLDADQRAAVARGVAGMGDFQKTQVLNSLAAAGTMGPDERAAFLDMVGDMESDYTKGQVLQVILRQPGSTPAQTALVLDGVGRIGGDFQKGEVLTRLLQDRELGSADLIKVVDATDGMGDFQRSAVLRGVLGHHSADAAVQRAVLKASAGLGDFERGRVRALLREDI